MAPLPKNYQSRIHQKTRAVAVGGFVLSPGLSLMTGSVGFSVGGGSTSASQMENDMRVQRQFGQTVSEFTQMQLEKVGKTKAAAPLLPVQARVQHSLAQAGMLKDNAEATELSVSMPLWELTCDSMFKDSYSINYDLQAALWNKPAKLNRVISCEGKVPQQHSLDEWHAHEDALIVQAARDVADLCTGKFLNEIGVPEARLPEAPSAQTASAPTATQNASAAAVQAASAASAPR